MARTYQLTVLRGDSRLVLHFNNETVMNDVARQANRNGFETRQHPGALSIEKSLKDAMATIDFWFGEAK
jgi:hypothetical protein